MRKSIKHLLMSSLFMLFLLPLMQGQNATMVQYHHVAPENRADAFNKLSEAILSSDFPSLDNFKAQQIFSNRNY